MSVRVVRITALAIAFAGSGAAGLIAEQGFEKLLGTLLGTNTPASAAVLAMYFGGLTIGAWLYGRASRRRSSPARAWATYGALEIAIALACTTLAFSFDRLVPVFVPLLRVGAGDPFMLTAMRLVVAGCWVLPVTIPMGATFPAVVDGLDFLPERPRRTAVSVFYATNLVGAIGAAAAGPWLIFPRLGIDRSLGLAAALDVVAALCAFELAWSQRRATGGRRSGASPEHDPEHIPSSTPLIVVGGLSGFVLFSLEVTWTHLIGTVIGNSVYAFATMLTIVLAALGFGAAVSGLIASRFGRVPAYVPGAALVLVCVALTVCHPYWPESPHALARAGPMTTTFAQAETARAGIAAKLLFPPAFVLGTVYPLLLRLDAFPSAGAGWIAARMGAVNALGSIAGALLTGFVMIPLLGAELTLHLLAAICLVAGALVVDAFAVRRALRIAAPLVAASGLVALTFARPWNRLHLTSGEQVYLERSHVFEDSRLLFFHEDTHGGFTTVVENSAGGLRNRVLLTNGKFQGNDTGEMAAQDGLALIPMMFVEQWHDALVIGLGTGRSAHVARTMRFDRVVIGEIAPGIVTAARSQFSHINGRVLDQPNVSLALTDARNHLLLHDDAFDLISMEISSVWIAGATNLYSREFYGLCKARLRPRGVLQQWIQLHHISIEELASAISAMRSAFPRVSLFVAGGQGVLVATTQEQRSVNEFFARLGAFGAELGDNPDTLARQLHASRLLGPGEVDAFLSEHPATPNTDKNRFLEYTTPTHALERTRGTTNLRIFASYSSLLAQEVDEGADHVLASAARKMDQGAVKRALQVDR